MALMGCRRILTARLPTGVERSGGGELRSKVGSGQARSGSMRALGAGGGLNRRGRMAGEAAALRSIEMEPNSMRAPMDAVGASEELALVSSESMLLRRQNAGFR